MLTRQEERTALIEAIGAGIFVALLLSSPIALGLAAIFKQAIESDTGLPYQVLVVIAWLISFLGFAYLVSKTLQRRKLSKLKSEKDLFREQASASSRRSYEQQYRADLERNESEAKEATARVTAILKSASDLSAMLPVKLRNSVRLIQQADEDFSENAYGPFWDGIEAVATDLSSFSRNTNELSKLAADYYSSLKGREHNFPVFPCRAENLGDPRPIAQEFRRIVRKGQTNFEFANIWEHRRTRDVLISGFKTLGDAVNNLGDVVEQSLLSLQRATSSDIARLADEQIYSRSLLTQEMRQQTQIASEQSRMLDNIQRHRKPS